MKNNIRFRVILVLVFSLVSLSANAALVSRFGGQAYYDDKLNITWMANANVNGVMPWNNAVTWANNLVFGGASNWRLPSMDVNGDLVLVDCSTVTESVCRDNEYGYMFYQNGVTKSTAGPFSGIESQDYWSSTIYAPSPANAWDFNFINGDHNWTGIGPGTSLFAWAVADGDVLLTPTVPLPAAFWLFGSGLVGLISIAKRRKQ